MGARNFQIKNGLVVDGDITAVNLDASGDITLGVNKKIFLGSEDTFIYADTDTSEDLHIGADGHIELEPDNDLIVKVGTTEYVRFDGDEQRVGIGTNAPAVNLHVSHATDPKIRVQDTTANFSSTLAGYSGGAYLAMGDMDSNESSFLVFGAFSSINNLNTKSRDFHLYGTNTTTGLYFDESAGKFGIGTTSPGHLLEVVGDGSNGEIVVNRASGAEILLQAQSATGVIGTNTNHDLDIKTNATTRIKIEDGGNVGIGTATPNQKLTVEGSMSLKEQASANTDAAAYGQLWVKNDDPNNLYFTNGDGSDVQITDGASIAGGGGSPAGSDTFIQYNNGGSFGATTLAYTDTSGAEQYKIDVSSSVAPFVIVQTGTGNAFEVHDDTDPDNNRFEIDQFGRVAVQGQAGTNSAALYAGGVIASASRIRSAAGSASNLAFSTTGDTNTGMYFPAADNLGFSTGGTERFRFGSSGEILIGGSAAGTSGQVLTSGGSGAAVTWEDAASGGVSLANDGNNRVVTGTGSGGINGEANLTFDGSTLALAGKQTITVNDDVSEAFKVTITDTDSTVDSTPFVIDGDGRVGIGTDSPVDNFALTLNGDGTSYEGLAFQVGGSTKFKLSSDSTAMYFDSAINSGNQNFRVKDSGGNLRPALGIEGSNYSVAIGYNGTSGSSLSPNNTLQVNVGTENGVQDKDDGILLLNSDLSIAANDMIGGIGFATRDGNIPSSVTEAACAIVARAREDHTTTEKGGYLEFLYSPAGKDDDTVSSIGMTLIEGKLAVNNGGLHPLTTMTLYHNGSDFNDGLTIIRNDTSVSDGDFLGAIGFDAKDGNAPSRATEASAGIAAFAAEDHSTGDKGGDLTFFTSPINQDDDTASVERMRITSEGKVIIGDTPNFTSQHDGLSKFTIQGTDAGMLIEKHDDSASGGPTLSLYRYSASEADGDLIGQINFRGEGSTGNPSTYMAIRTEIEDTTEGTKDGSLIIRGLVNNSQTEFVEINSAGLTLKQGPYNRGNVSKDANTVSGSSLADGSSVTLFTVPVTTRGFKATIFFKDTSNTEYQIEEIMGYNTGSGVDFTSFGQVFSGAAAIGSLDATNSSGTTLIKFTNGQGGAINYQATISVTHMDLS